MFPDTRAADRWQPGVATALREAVEDALPTLDEAQGRFRTHKRSTVVRATLAGTDVVIKRFNPQTLAKRMKLLVLPNPALRAWRNAAVVTGCGLHTARPIGCISRRDGNGLLRHYLITDYLSGPSAEAYFRDETIPAAARAAAAERILEALRTLHQAGYVHGDLKGRNIILQDGAPCFIDLDSLMYRWPAPVLRHWVRKDYARLTATVPTLAEAGVNRRD